MSGIEGVGQVVPTSKKVSSPLERIYDKVNAHNARLGDMVSSLTNAMDQMVGAVPSSVPEQAEAIGPAATSISKIDDRLGEQGTLLTQLAEQVDRVQGLSSPAF